MLQVPVLLILRLVSRVSCRFPAEGLETKTVLGRMVETVLLQAIMP